METWEMIADQRCQLLAILQAFNTEQWHTPSLCTGWTVRDVVGHLVTPFVLGTGSVLLRLIRHGFNLNTALLHAAKYVAQRPTPELVSVLQANVSTRWTPPGVGPEAPLTDILMHTLDICHPLRLPHNIEPAKLQGALTFLVGRKGRMMSAPAWRAGLHLIAEDLPWSWGAGLDVHGPAQPLMMVLGGRQALIDALTGPGVPELRARLAKR